VPTEISGLENPEPRPHVRLYSPMPLTSGKGNAVSALRIAQLLREAGFRAAATDSPAVDPADMLIVLNAWRSAPVALDFKLRHPERPLIPVLTGTDIFPDFPSHPEVVPVLEAAETIVAWHHESVRQLPERFRAKTRVIYKSAPDVPGAAPVPRRMPEFPHPVEVLVIGHLREIKVPFLAAAAARLLPEASRVQILHAGEALTDEMAAAAREEMQTNPRYQWLGGLTREALFQHLRRASLTVNSSLAEGGANAVIESLRCGVPVLASRIPGNTGLLGRDWPGLFDCGDTAGLAALLQRCESDPVFYSNLVQRALLLASHFVPEQERDGWKALLDSLAVSARSEEPSGCH
jgi:putative glycosyltransferase (TIGR04348 family)